ncbi:MAG TPA: hypothetical protein VGK99_05515 [Acidobacteriota bacterium]
MRRLVFFALACCSSAFAARRYEFAVGPGGDRVVSFQARGMAGTWRQGTAPVVTVRSGRNASQLVLIHSPQWFSYSIFLPETNGTVQMESDADFEIQDFKQQSEPDEVLRHAPILVSRNEPGILQNDVPLVVYCQVSRVPRRLDYTCIFSNEDGGTDTQALFARWGRSADIELVYSIEWDSAGTPRETIQSYDHKIVPFIGKKEGDHPIIHVATKNNVFDSSGAGAYHFQLPPRAYDSFERTRESVMDEQPWTYSIMREELEREQKNFDPRRYLYVDFRGAVQEAAIGAGVKFKSGEEVSSYGEKPKNRVNRSGWTRIGIPLPPGKTVSDVESLFFDCDKAGQCRIEAIAQTMLLDETDRPVKIPMAYSFRF